MDLFLTILFLFSLGSMFGWILELFYRRFFSAKKWLNPGFLVGPCLPLYGFGLILLYLLASVRLDFIPSDLWRNVVTVVAMGLCMTLIEFLAGLIFIHGMKVKLWDYSDRRGNILGLICPQFSVYWTLLGAVYKFFIHPFFAGAVSWLFAHFTFIFVVGMFYGVLLVDVCWSFRLLARIRAFAKEHEIVVRLEEFKKTLAERTEKHRFGRFLFALQERSRSTADSLQLYFEAVRRKTDKLTRKPAKTPDKPSPSPENAQQGDANGDDPPQDPA